MNISICNARELIGLKILILGAAKLQIRQNSDFKCVKDKNLTQIFVGIPIIPILQLFHVYLLNFWIKESKPKDYFVYLHLSTARLTMMPIEVGGATGLDTT
jgi:hypothetical protein